MPSTHASACTFFAAYAPLASLYLPLHPNLGSLAVYAPIIIVPWAGMIVLSRVWLGHHTWPQVAAGSVFGICFASLWFRLWVDNAGGIRTLGEEMEELVNSLLGT
jgi:dolichyldiphosphatase